MTIEELSEEYVKGTLIDSELIMKSAFKAGAYKVLEEIEDELNELPITKTLRGIYHKLNELKGKE